MAFVIFQSLDLILFTMTIMTIVTTTGDFVTTWNKRKLRKSTSVSVRTTSIPKFEYQENWSTRQTEQEMYRPSLQLHITTKARCSGRFELVKEDSKVTATVNEHYLIPMQKIHWNLGHSAKKYQAFQENDIFGLKSLEDKQYCLLASFEGRLVIRTLGTDYASRQETIEDIRPEDVSLLGVCAKDKLDKPYLELIWSANKGKRFRLRLSFVADIASNLKKGTKEYKWKLSDVKLTYYPPDARTTNETLVGSMLSRSQIFAPLTQSFYCKHSLNVTLADSSNVEHSERKVDVTLQFKADMKIQPYNVESNGFFSNKYLCERSREIGLMERLRSNTTILAGCILGFVAVAILIGYSAKRYMFAEQHGYAYMD